MKKCNSLTLTVFAITLLLSKYSFAQQKEFSFLYHYTSLCPNSGKLSCQITIHDDTLWHISRDRHGTLTTIKSKIRKSSVDSIKSAVSKFISDTSILLANKCIKNCDVHFMEITTPEKRISLSMNNTFSVEGYKISKVLDTYLPTDKRLNITKEYVADAWDCELTYESKGAANEFETALFDSFCIRLLIENEYKKLSDQIDKQLMILEDPVTGDVWAKANDSSGNDLAKRFNNYSNQERLNLFNGHNFPCLPLTDTVFVVDNNQIFINPHKFKHNGVVFLTIKTSSSSDKKCNIQLFGLRKIEMRIQMFFKVTGKSKAIYVTRFTLDKNTPHFEGDEFIENRFYFTCSEHDMFR